MEAATKHRDGPVALAIPEIPERAPYETIAVRPLTPVIGAEIEGIDLSAGLSDAQFAEVRRALLDWKVVFFRDQDITTEQHLDFGRRFGPLEVFPFAPPKPGYPEVLAITHNEKSRGRENTWHSDVTWREIPSLGSILRAIEVPPVGGDTLFADMYLAYEGLADEIKERIDGRVAVHDFPHIRRDFRKKGVSEAEIEAFEKTYPKVEHPVVRTHPETGPQGALRQRRLHPVDRRAGAGGVGRAAEAPLRPGGDPGIPVPLPLAEELDRLLGQPRLPALRGLRLLPGGAADGAGDRRRRPPGLGRPCCRRPKAAAARRQTPSRTSKT